MTPEQPAEPDQRRELYRTSLAGTFIDIKVEHRSGCVLVDVNANGLAFTTEARFPVGLIAKLVIEHAGQVGVGFGELIYRQPIERRRFRYGVQLEPGQTAFRALLHELSIQEQRKQLRRAAELRYHES